MSEEKSLLEILTDEQDAENIVLQDEEGNETEFEQIATIPFEDRLFCILRPLGLVDIAEDEAFVFELTEDETQENLEIVTDEGLAQCVFEQYYKLCDEDDNPNT